jgi:hypothetical protein
MYLSEDKPKPTLLAAEFNCHGLMNVIKVLREYNLSYRSLCTVSVNNRNYSNILWYAVNDAGAVCFVVQKFCVSCRGEDSLFAVSRNIQALSTKVGTKFRRQVAVAQSV